MTAASDAIGEHPAFRDLDGAVDSIAEQIRSVRRHLHAHPEPSREEFGTASYIAGALDREGIHYRRVASGRGLIAGPGPIGEGSCVAIRGDIDALRIQEENEVDYRSTRPGLMHACGHDAHAAMTLGAAIALHRCSKSLPGLGWRAIFQPAEETGEGAAEMVSAGAMEGVDGIIALHVDPEREVGRVGVRTGVLTAFCQDIEIEVIGRGGHAARPHLTIDPIAASANLLSTIYAAIPRSTDSREAVVVSFGVISGGASPNVIPERVVLRGTLRTLGYASAGRTRDHLDRIIRGVSTTFGVEISAKFGDELDAVSNDPIVTDAFASAATMLLGLERVDQILLPSLGGEDFSGYLNLVPGSMLRLGVASGPETRNGLHNSRFNLDERALAIGAKLLACGAVSVATRLATWR